MLNTTKVETKSSYLNNTFFSPILLLLVLFWNPLPPSMIFTLNQSNLWWIRVNCHFLWSVLYFCQLWHDSQKHKTGNSVQSDIIGKWGNLEIALEYTHLTFDSVPLWNGHENCRPLVSPSKSKKNWKHEWRIESFKMDKIEISDT